ncbi:hypothetical protein N2152v2_000354 [Parachlorella kessleri]
MAACLAACLEAAIVASLAAAVAAAFAIFVAIATIVLGGTLHCVGGFQPAAGTWRLLGKGFNDNLGVHKTGDHPQEGARPGSQRTPVESDGLSAGRAGGIGPVLQHSGKAAAVENVAAGDANGGRF